jgi:glycosyltransferase involved in cell wall biosynthesis
MKNRAHILLLTSSYPSSGDDPRASAGLFVKDFAHELSKRMKVTVISQMTQMRDSGRVRQSDSGIEVIRFPWAGKERPLSTLRFPSDLRLIFSVLLEGMRASFKFSRQNKVDLSLALWALPSGLWALLLKWTHKIDYAVWCLGSDIWDYGKGPLKKRLLRLILRQARILYADGYRLKGDVELLSGRKCHFMSTCRRLPVHVSAAVISSEKRHYLFIGRYHPNKGPDVLLEAIAILDAEIRKVVHFHFFGVGPLQEQLEEFIRMKQISDIVSLNGLINEKSAVAYLKACRALIIPSRLESIPVVLSDALQTGCAVIASDVGDMGYLIRKYGAGIVVPPESPAEMAKAIRDDILYPEDYSEGGKELLKLFDLSNTAERFVSEHFQRL